MYQSKSTGSRFAAPHAVSALRKLLPERPLSFDESLRLAELQASRLLEAAHCTDGPVPESVITDLPRIDVRRSTKMIGPGGTAWSRGKWRIVINAGDIPSRQRFTLAHELKHILDASHEDVVYRNFPSGPYRTQQVEAICNHFAACLLMPRVWVKRLWGHGVQDLSSLAWHFEVSYQAMLIRLHVLGLVDVPPRALHASHIGHLAVKARPYPKRSQAPGTPPTYRRLPPSRPLAAIRVEGMAALHELVRLGDAADALSRSAP